MAIKLTLLAVLCSITFTEGYTQNVGIGLANPTKGRLEIYGALGGGTVASFGTDGTGISLQRNWPTIGFNQYRDNSNIARYMGTGKASWLYYDPAAGNFYWDVYNTAGVADQEITATGFRALTISSLGNIGIGPSVNPQAPLQFTNDLRNRKIVLWGNDPSDVAFYGFGVNAAALRYNVDAVGANHSFYAANTKLLNIGGDKKLTVEGNSQIKGFTALNNTTDGYTPKVAAEIWGPVALANSYTVNLQLGTWITNSTISSYVKVHNPTTNSALELDIANGVIDGQIIVIEGNLNPFTIRVPGSVYSNIYGSGNMTIGGGDVLTLIWNAQRNKWMRLAYTDN